MARNLHGMCPTGLEVCARCFYFVGPIVFTMSGNRYTLDLHFAIYKGVVPHFNPIHYRHKYVGILFPEFYNDYH